MKKILIRDLTLRDGQQSLFATRMNQKQVDRILPFYKDAGFYAMEVWGGAVPDSVMRYLGESPWDRLDEIKKSVGDVSKLTALSRGRNLFGYNPYPDEVIEGFCRNSVKGGIDIMRIFDALNDLDNMKSTIKFVGENGGQTDCAVCFTVDPKFSRKDRWKALLKGRPLPKKIFTVDYFVNKAIELEKLGADIITIKDMAGLLHPTFTKKLVKSLKDKVTVPIDIHTHCTPGYGLASVVVAMINGVDIIDTAMLTFSGGTAAPAFELIQLFADRLGIDTGVNLRSVAAINKELRTIRSELSEFDSSKDMIPIDFDISRDSLPSEIEILFDRAVYLAKSGRMTKLLDVIHLIEAYFNLPKPNEAVKNAEIPGGMYSNMLAQLHALKQGHLLDHVLEFVPKVRVDAGCPPLVTPTSQIVGVQAVNCVIDENKELEPFYTNKTKQFINLVQGSYGKTPIPIDPKMRTKITGDPTEVPYDTSQYQKPDNPQLEDCGDLPLARNEKEMLLLELFPSVAEGFLKKVRAEDWKNIQEEERRKEADDPMIQGTGALE